MNLVNLTPHAINLITNTGETVSLPSTGTIARVSSKSVTVGETEGILLTQVTFGEVESLPPSDGRTFIVSVLVRSALPNRKDLASPGELVRDAAGNVIGCKTLIVN